MAVQDDLARAEAHLQALEREEARILGQQRQELAVLRENNRSQTVIDDLTDKLEAAEKRFQQFIGEAKAKRDVAAAAVKIDQEARRAALEAKEKAVALTAWVERGGAVADFEAAWPRIWITRLEKAAADAEKLREAAQRERRVRF